MLPEGNGVPLGLNLIPGLQTAPQSLKEWTQQMDSNSSQAQRGQTLKLTGESKSAQLLNFLQWRLQ